jgi:hypothetical protein
MLVIVVTIQDGFYVIPQMSVGMGVALIVPVPNPRQIMYKRISLWIFIEIFDVADKDFLKKLFIR